MQRRCVRNALESVRGDEPRLVHQPLPEVDDGEIRIRVDVLGIAQQHVSRVLDGGVPVLGLDGHRREDVSSLGLVAVVRDDPLERCLGLLPVAPLVVELSKACARGQVTRVGVQRTAPGLRRRLELVAHLVQQAEVVPGVRVLGVVAGGLAEQLLGVAHASRQPGGIVDELQTVFVGAGHRSARGQQNREGDAACEESLQHHFSSWPNRGSPPLARTRSGRSRDSLIERSVRSSWAMAVSARSDHSLNQWLSRAVFSALP